MLIHHSTVRLAAYCAALWLLPLTTTARAQAPEPVRVALFKTASSLAELTQLGAALDPVLQADIGRVSEVAIAAVPPLDLPSLQLALDCVGETPSCLSAALERSKVEALLSPSLARSEGALVLSLLRYDPRRTSPLQVVTRRLPGDAPEAVVFDAATQLVGELYGLPAPPAAEPETPLAEPAPELPEHASPADLAPGALALAGDQPSVASVSETPSLLWPIVLGAVGLSAIGTGIGFGVAANSSEERYAGTSVTTEAEARTANERLSGARTQATISNVAFGVGAAACVAAGVVFVTQRLGSSHPDAAPHALLTVGPGWLSYTGGF